MTHQHLCFQSLYGFQSNTDNDDDGSTADGYTTQGGQLLQELGCSLTPPWLWS